MSTPRPPRILQATAQNRIVAGYAVPPSRVAPFLPDGLVPHERDGTAYVSLVGVELTKVRVLGLVPPGFRRVPAVELRVHVRPDEAPPGRNGTWTVQAHVPRRLVAWSARVLYGEPVAVTSMQPIEGESPDAVSVPDGCSYASRCPMADEHCRANDPSLMAAGETRRAMGALELAAAEEHAAEHGLARAHFARDADESLAAVECDAQRVQRIPVTPVTKKNSVSGVSENGASCSP